MNELLKNHPTPWTLGTGYDQLDQGYYIADAKGLIVLAVYEGNGYEREAVELLVETANNFNEGD